MFGISRGAGVATKTIAVTDLAVRSVNHQFNALAHGRLSSSFNCVTLCRVQRGCFFSPFSLYSPFITLRNNVYVSHWYLCLRP